MALTIEQLITAAAPAICHTSNKPYRLSEVFTILSRPVVRYARLFDPVNELGTNIIWSIQDEIKTTTEASKIDLVKALMENAINTLDFELASRAYATTNPLAANPPIDNSDIEDLEDVQF